MLYVFPDPFECTDELRVTVSQSPAKPLALSQDRIAIKIQGESHTLENQSPGNHNEVLQMKHRVPVEGLLVELCPGALVSTVGMKAAI